MRDETKCLHAGYTPKNGEPRVVPIVQSTTYVYDSTDEVASVFDEPTKSLIYSRFANPTVMAVEEKIAALEGGVGLCVHHQVRRHLSFQSLTYVMRETAF